jgi:hypothetical protein
LEDLKLLDIHGDVVTHTSDYFDTIYKYAIQLIKDGKAYADDTEQAQVRVTFAPQLCGLTGKRCARSAVKGFPLSTETTASSRTSNTSLT